MKALLTTVLCFAIGLSATAAIAGKTPQEKRTATDQMAGTTLVRLFKERPEAKALQRKSYGYAVFDQAETAIMISGGGGSGVAVETTSGKRIYMKTASAGIGLGLGFHLIYTVFLFETKEAFEKFIDNGMGADTSASAAAGKSGKNAESSFRNGIAVFQLTDKGLIAQASVKGTKYWQDKKLNGKE